MGKKYKADELKKIIVDSLSTAFVAIDHLGRSLAAMKLTEAELVDTVDNERTKQAKLLISTIALVNDIIHPAHKIAYDLFPQSAHAFIDQCIKQRDVALKTNLTSNCNCCKV